jgi:CHASE2 domain-containing sensor protein
LHVAGIIAIGCATTLAQLYVGWFQTAEAWTRDIRNTLTPQVAEAPANVSVLYVTEGMLDELEYRVPVNRAYLAKLLEPLRDAGVAALGLDILFDHPTSEDQVLRQALTSMPFPVVYAWINESHGLRPGQVENLEKFIGTGYRGLATFLADSRDGVVRELPEPSDSALRRWLRFWPNSQARKKLNYLAPWPTPLC